MPLKRLSSWRRRIRSGQPRPRVIVLTLATGSALLWCFEFFTGSHAADSSPLLTFSGTMFAVAFAIRPDEDEDEDQRPPRRSKPSKPDDDSTSGGSKPKRGS